MTATATDVARWMSESIEAEEYLYQDVAANEIGSRFGAVFTHINQHGNVAINPDVLREFKKLSGDSVVWDRSERLWRKRQDYDSPGRQQ